MIDQATELRKLVLRSMRERAAAAGPPPRLLLVAGSQAQVGVTTLAVNFAIGLADQGLRVVIVDADVFPRGVAALCGLVEPMPGEDVCLARRDIHEVLQRGPAGIQVVPGLWAPGETVDCSPSALERLVRQFRNLGPYADVVLMDVGAAGGEFVRRFAAAASEVLLISTPETASLMNGYARLKAVLRGLGKGIAWLVVNRCDDAERAAQVHQVVDESCQRFLGAKVCLLGHVPEDEQAARGAAAAVPFLLGAPTCPAGRAVQRLAATLAADWPDSSRHVA